MILTGTQIHKEVKEGNIEIDPFHSDQLNPNSYNLTLSDQLLIYEPEQSPAIATLVSVVTNKIRNPLLFTKEMQWKDGAAQQWFESGTPFPASPLDWKKKNVTATLTIPTEGALLFPGKIYLGATIERTFSDKFVPILDGRSSGARLGITVHITGGFGDIGFNGRWTLEIRVEEPVRIYPGVKFCQVRFDVPHGDTTIQYKGKYQNSTEPQASKVHTEK
jgi:dCTP deaminase